MTSDMKPSQSALGKIAKAIQQNKTFFIAGHTKPDGDTIGSSIALQSLLKRFNKKAKVFSRDTIPSILSFLKGYSDVIVTDRVLDIFDCAIIMECTDFNRMGNIIKPCQAQTVINIDHHKVHTEFGGINFIDPNASSSAELVYRLFRYMKVDINKHEAEALYAGLVTDTGRFQFANTSPEALEMASDLVRCGVKTEKIFEHIYQNNTLSSLHLLGCALDSMKTDESGRIAYMVVTQEAFEYAKSSSIETEGIINYTLQIPETQIGILFYETKQGNVTKVSFRSRSSLDVSLLARHYGGGGHRNASGCTVPMPLEKAIEDVLAKAAQLK